MPIEFYQYSTIKQFRIWINPGHTFPALRNRIEVEFIWEGSFQFLPYN